MGVRILKQFRRLFDFHQPRLRHLDYIDLVVGNKPVLLLTWDAVHADRICILPGKLVYHTTSGGIICKLPPGTEFVDVILHNLWRSKKISIKLQQIAADPQTLAYLNELLHEKLTLTNTQPAIIAQLPELKNMQPAISLSIELRQINMFIIQTQLNDYAP